MLSCVSRKDTFCNFERSHPLSIERILQNPTLTTSAHHFRSASYYFTLRYSRSRYSRLSGHVVSRSVNSSAPVCWPTPFSVRFREGIRAIPTRNTQTIRLSTSTGFVNSRCVGLEGPFHFRPFIKVINRQGLLSSHWPSCREIEDDTALF